MSQNMNNALETAAVRRYMLSTGNYRSVWQHLLFSLKYTTNISQQQCSLNIMAFEYEMDKNYQIATARQESMFETSLRSHI